MTAVSPAWMNKARRHMEQYKVERCDKHLPKSTEKVLKGILLRGKIPRNQAYMYFREIFADVLNRSFGFQPHVVSEAEPLTKSLSTRFEPLYGHVRTFELNEFGRTHRKYEEINCTLGHGVVRVSHDQINVSIGLAMFIIGHHAVARMMEREISAQPLPMLLGQSEKILALTHLFRALSSKVITNQRVVMPLNEHAMFGGLGATSIESHILSKGAVYSYRNIRDFNPYDEFTQADTEFENRRLSSFVKINTAIEYDALSPAQESVRDLVEDFWVQHHKELLNFSQRYTDILNSGITRDEVHNYVSTMRDKFQKVASHKDWLRHQG